MKKIFNSICICLLVFSAEAQINPDTRPEALKTETIQVGEYNSFIAENGMDVFLIRKEGYPKFRVSVQFNLPSLQEEKDPEVRKVLSAILSEGNSKYSKDKIKEITETYAATAVVSLNTATCDGMKNDLDKIVPIISSSVLSPEITRTTVNVQIEKEIKLLKDKTDSEEKKELAKRKKNGIDIIRDSLAITKITKSEQKNLTISELESLTASKVNSYFKTYINPKNSLCIITGDFTIAEAKALVNKYFGKWKGGEKFDADSEFKYTTRIPEKTKVFVVDKPNAIQSNISVLWPLVDGFPYSEQEPVLMIMNQIFGDGYNSNLNNNLRKDKGLTYGVKNFLSLNVTGGYCITSTLVRNTETAYALENILLEMLRIRNELVSQKDLDMAVNGMLGDYARSMSSLKSPTIVGFGMAKSKYNLPDNYLQTYPLKIAKVSAKDVRSAAQKYILPYNSDIIIEGNLSKLKGMFEKFGEVEYFNSDGKRVN